MFKTEKLSLNQNDIFLAWFIVGCGGVGAMNLAKLAPSMGRLIDYFHITLFTSGLIGAIFSALTLTTGLIGGVIISKYGPRLAMLLGLLISLVGCLIPVLKPELAGLMIGRALEGYGFLLINLSAPVLLSLHTGSENRGRVMGIWGSFMPAGNAVIILIAPIIYLISDWHLLWVASAVYTAVICLFAVYIIPPDPNQFKIAITEKLSLVVRQTLKKTSLVVTGITFACHSLIFLGIMQFLPYYFENIAGYSETFSYLAAASYCLISFTGHLFCGFLLHRGAQPEQLISFAFIIAGCLVALFFGVFDTFIPVVELPIIKLFSIMCVAFFMGLTPPTIFYLVSYIAPPSRITPINYGYMAQIQAIGIFGGPFLFGWLVDVTGGWLAIGYFSVFISIFGISGGLISSKIIPHIAK